MKKKNTYIFIGKVLKSLPNLMFLVFISKIKKELVCYISGKIRINYIKILPGDEVKVELDKTYSNKGRIIYRIK